MNANDRYDSLTQYYAGIVGIDWRLLKAQQRAESNFNPVAKSAVGALGLTQFMEKTWDEFVLSLSSPIGDLVDRRNPELAIRAQAWLMGRLLRAFPERRYALAAYNWGQGRVKNLMMDFPGLAIEEHILHMPKETRDYIQRIMGYYEEYAK